MTLQDLLSVDTIMLDMIAIDKHHALQQMAQRLDNYHRLSSYEDFIDDVMEREAIISTNMEMGVAIPHCKSIAIGKSTVSIARLSEPLDWEDGGAPVNIIFLLAVSPLDKDFTHLQVISKIAALLIEEDFIELLNTTSDRQAIIDAIQTYIDSQE